MENLKKIGILGFAHGHVSAYCDEWNKNPESRIIPALGWDHDSNRLEQACKTYRIKPAKSYKEVLSQKDIEAVVIGSETSLHTKLVKESARAGKTIILQKPLCLTLKEADSIIASLNKYRVRFTMAWQMRVDPHNLEIKHLLDSGRFGRILMIRRKHCLATHKWKNFEASWHVSPEYNRDIFADDASHAVDFIYWLKGMPVSVFAELGTLRNPKIINDHAIAIFRYHDGTFGEIVCSFASSAGENCVEILCEKGFISLNHGDGPSTDIPWPEHAIQLKWFLDEENKWTASTLPPVKSHGVRIRGLAKPLAEFVRNERDAIASAIEGKDVLHIIMACYESNKKGKRVKL